jgi:hypothetical protein
MHSAMMRQIAVSAAREGRSYSACPDEGFMVLRRWHTKALRIAHNFTICDARVASG